MTNKKHEKEVLKAKDFEPKEMGKQIEMIDKKPVYIFTNMGVDLLSYCLIFIIIYGSSHMYYNMDSIILPIKEKYPEIKFPSYEDLTISVVILVVMIIVNEVFKFFFQEIIARNLTPRYFSEAELINIYKKKVATNIYKFFLYLFSTIFGYYVLGSLPFFPWSMGMGNGEFKNAFANGYPEFTGFEKPEYFDLYICFNLSFALFDGWVLLTNPLQSDFLFMVLHHLSTYSLVIFSFLANYSSVGSIIFFVHYFGDVFSYIVRVCLHMNISDKYSFISTATFLIVFSYTRLFVFGDILYQTVLGLNFKWRALEWYLVSFLFILMALNLLWIILISKKFIMYCLTGNIEEIYKFKIHDKNKKH
jgi:hypothetical protein